MRTYSKIDLEKVERGIGYMIKDTLSRVFIPGYWHTPNLDLLPNPEPNSVEEKDVYPIDPAELAKILINYGIKASITNIRVGSSVTTYEIKLPIGADSSKLIKRTDDLSRDISEPDLRVLASIPGTVCMGIEIPNRIRRTVPFKAIASEIPDKPLMVALGQDTYGKNIYLDIAETPHLLIAGTTGSGKSVWLNVAISSLLCKRTPKEVQFLMVDPKRVELKFYESIPHLIKPIAYGPEDADELLDFAVEEMERRFILLQKTDCRDIKSYNSVSKDKMPYIVFIIDEFSDLLMTAKFKKVFEDKVIRLAQKARAVGIHMILSTQKPIKAVVTSIIKSNLPARISFRVPSSMDSRTILDENGSEKLLGKGDMLVKTSTLNMVRVQSPFVTDSEIKAIVSGGL